MSSLEGQRLLQGEGCGTGEPPLTRKGQTACSRQWPWGLVVVPGWEDPVTSYLKQRREGGSFLLPRISLVVLYNRYSVPA